ncbi:eCIS core domain-containing protein [Teredinibacter purpureus]|uniref:eCIS core domain-containing protein n=1 Tax=Teredinibacter purpureus TaxID=2731756 RepID=UPI0009E37E98|nr:DUF4157 domain-containing protein [Teredinibacter purpureus]
MHDVKDHGSLNTDNSADGNSKNGKLHADYRDASLDPIIQRKLCTTATNFGNKEQNIRQKKGNNTGLPDTLKAGIENLSGYAMDDVKVHYNSHKPAKIQAHAYAQGNAIHVASGQEKHLPHEAWHVVQQKQGRVQPTLQMKKTMAINDNKALEREADVMGAKAASFSAQAKSAPLKKIPVTKNVVQRFYVEADNPDGYKWLENSEWDARYYEKSSRQPFIMRSLYRRNNTARPRSTSIERKWSRQTKKFGRSLNRQKRSFSDFVPGRAEDNLLKNIPTTRKVGEDVSHRHDMGEIHNQIRDAALPDYAQAVAMSIADREDKDVGEVRYIIYTLQNMHSRTIDARAYQNLTRAIAKSVAGLAGEDKNNRVEKLREMVERLPEHYRESVVNMAHKAINPHDRQISVPDAVFLGPSKVEHSSLVEAFEEPSSVKAKSSADDHLHISNRGVQQVVRIEGELYTPIYMSVFADASGKKGKPAFKDFEQDENGQIKIHTGGSGDKENTLWISIGRPLRQIKWIEKYGSQGGTPLIRSFLIPLPVANIISGETATEHRTKGYDVDFNVDKHYEMNQTGINKAASLEMLRRYALPGSLRTYSDPRVFVKKPPPNAWGDTRSLHELNEQMGIPSERLKDFDVFVDHTGQDFTSQKEYGRQADDLARIYAYYHKNASLLPEGEDMPMDADRQVKDFYNKHRPRKKISLRNFIENYVRPWASQAQISKVIADDYEDIVQHPEMLPEEAPKISLSSTSRKRHRGERRSASVALSRHIQTLMQSRYQFLQQITAAAGEIVKVFGDKTYKGKGKRYLGPIRDWVGTVQNNYGFSSGNIESIKTYLPQYRTQIVDHLAVLEQHCSGDAGLKAVKQCLQDALFIQLDTSTVKLSGYSMPVSFSSTGDKSKRVPLEPDAEVRDGLNRVLQVNNTAGGGDCFYHSLHEARSGNRSNRVAQQTIRDQIVRVLRGNPRLAASHFGGGAGGLASMQRFITEISTQSTWVPDHGPAIIADALRLRIIIHRPNGSIYYDAQPNATIVGPAQGVIHVQYTGAHYNSYTLLGV